MASFAMNKGLYPLASSLVVGSGWRQKGLLPAKSVADVFKMRNRVGLNVAIEALKTYRQRFAGGLDDLLHYARICRVEGVMRPYLEAIL